MKTKESEVIKAVRSVIEANESYAANRSELYAMLEGPIRILKQALSAYDKEQANDGNQMEGETIEWVSEILMGSESLPASIEILRQFVDQNTAHILSQIAEKDKRIAELEAENENLKSDADRFKKLQSDIEKISKSPLPDLGFRKPSWEDLNKPMDI